MKIFDCFMYFDEEVVLDLRLNILNPVIDYFIIVESTFNHKGEKRKLKFDIKKYKKFEKKIVYLIFDEEPSGIEQVLKTDNEGEKSRKHILNAALRENGQRNYISKGLEFANEKDLILISDVDEIPNLEKIDWNTINDQIILFKQDMFYYKLNLKLPDLIWSGTKACKKKYLKSPQWLRNIKTKKIPFWKFYKERQPQLIDDGGWHFSFLKKPKEISQKIKVFAHQEFKKNIFFDEKKIAERIKNQKDLFDRNIKYEKVEINEEFPKYILENKLKFNEWII